MDYISGVVESKKGNLLDALDLIGKAWEFVERRHRIDRENRLLLDLARVEISIDNQSIDKTKVVVPGKWLSKLETHAMEHDLPGIRMYATLLKSECYQNNGQFKDAQAILTDALKITDSLGVASLRTKINERIKELDGLLSEAGVPSDRKKD